MRLLGKYDLSWLQQAFQGDFSGRKVQLPGLPAHDIIELFNYRIDISEGRLEIWRAGKEADELIYHS